MKPDNVLAAEPLILARLRAVLPPEVHVLAAADVAAVSAEQQPTPAVHVLYSGYEATDAQTGAAVTIEQTWLTVVVARNVADVEAGFHARQQAGPLAAQVVSALHRHRLLRADGTPLGARPLRLATAPSPGFSDGRFYLPLAWVCPINFWSDACPA